ncbi:MAG TPA: hypothetical protein VK897_27175, partial [Anaerolineales bacterium]|nr:hypothetical protein [Anaerolineales bacterium]
FFAPDQAFVTERLLSLLRPGGKLAVFYICSPDAEGTETALTKALTDIGMPYRVKDLSAQNAAHWQKKKQVLLELESTFQAEGNAFLFKNRLAECDGMQSFHRYLYIVPAA